MPQLARVQRKCKHCKERFLASEYNIKRGGGKFCSLSCAISCTNTSRFGNKKRTTNQDGEKNPNWKGGLIQSSKGYWYIYKPDHARAGKQGYVKRADLVLEKKLGRPLKANELAHHGPGGIEDDSPENLSLMTSKSHIKFHNTLRRITKK